MGTSLARRLDNMFPEQRSYFLKHRALQLRKAKRSKDLFVLARNQDFATFQTDAFPEHPELPLETLRIAMRVASDIDDVLAMVEFSLSHARMMSDKSNQSPLEELRAGNSDGSLRLMDLYEPEQRILWHILLAWELNDMGKVEEARVLLWRLSAKITVGLLNSRKSGQGLLTAQLLARVIDLDFVKFSELQTRLLNDEERTELCKYLANRGYSLTAIEIALSLCSKTRVANTLRSILEIQLNAGEKNEARKTIRVVMDICNQIKDSTDKRAQLELLAESVADGGEFSLAHNVVKKLGIGINRDKILRVIAEKEAMAGQFYKAIKTAQDIDDSFEKWRAISEICLTQLNTQDFNGALASADKIKSAYFRWEVLAEIAEAQSRSINIESAITTFKAAVETAKKIRTEYSEESEYYRYEAFKNIIGRLNSLNQFILAIDVAKQIKDEDRRDEVLSMIVQAMVTASDWEGACDIVQEIRHKLSKVSALADIATVFSINSRNTQAKIFFRESVKVAENIDYEYSRGEAFAVLIQAETRVIGFFAAFRRASKIKEKLWRDKAYLKLAKTEMDLGHFSNAILAIDKVDDKNEQPKELLDIGFVYIKAGMLTEAFKIVKKIKSGDFVGDLLSALAHAQIVAGETWAALQTARQIQLDYKRQEINFAILESLIETKNYYLALKTANEIDGKRDNLTEAYIENTIIDKDESLLHVAEIFETIGELGWARKAWSYLINSSNDSPSKKLQIMALASIAEKLMDERNIESAKAVFVISIEVAKSIEVMKIRAEVIQNIAHIEMKVGLENLAKKDFAAAIKIAKQIEEHDDKAYALRAVVMRATAAGEFHSAMRVTEEIRNPTYRCTTLIDLGWEADKSKRKNFAIVAFEAAMVTAREIKNPLERVELLIKIARGQWGIGETRLAIETLSMAVRSAKQIKDEKDGDDVFCDIIELQAEVGDIPGVLKTAKQVKDPLNLVWLSESVLINEEATQIIISMAEDAIIRSNRIHYRKLEALARVKAKLSKFMEALKLAGQIQDDCRRGQVLAKIAIIQAKAGDKRSALTTCQVALKAIEKTMDTKGRDNALSSVIEAQAITSEFSAAFQTLLMVKSDSEQENTLQTLIRYLIRAKKLQEAFRAAQKHKWRRYRLNAFCNITQAYIESGLLADAIETVKAIQDPKEHQEPLIVIATTQAKVGEFAAALKLAEYIDEVIYKSRALKAITEALIRRGEFTKAIKVTSNIEDLDIRWECLWLIAETQQKVDLVRDMCETLILGRTAVIEQNEQPKRSKRLALIANRFAEVGFAEESLVTLQAITINRNEHLIEVTSIMAQCGEREQLKALLIPCANYLDSTYKICGLLSKLYPEQAMSIAGVVSPDIFWKKSLQ